MAIPKCWATGIGSEPSAGPTPTQHIQLVIQHLGAVRQDQPFNAHLSPRRELIGDLGLDEERVPGSALRGQHLERQAGELFAFDLNGEVEAAVLLEGQQVETEHEPGDRVFAAVGLPNVACPACSMTAWLLLSIKRIFICFTPISRTWQRS